MSAPAIPIHVSRHAVWRAYERFPGFDPALIDVEIRDAFARGRVSPRKPPGVRNDDDAACVYAWTPDGFRVYVITPHYDETSLAVKTVLKSTLDPTWCEDGRLVIEKTTRTPGYWGKR